MKITTHSQSALSNTSDCLIVALENTAKLSGVIADIDKASDGHISALIKTKDITSRRGKCTLLFNVLGIKAKRVLVVGTHSKEAMNPKSLENLYETILKECTKTGAESIASYLPQLCTQLSEEKEIEFSTASILNSLYRFDAQKSKKSHPTTLKSFSFSISENNKAKTNTNNAIKKAQALVKGMNLCKDLGNLSGNVCTPEYLAKEATKMADNPKVSVKVIDEKSFASMGMGAFLSVAKGSELSAKLITINYQGGKKTDKPHVLVGKGITFDSGGISLKPGAAMDEMKYDMCGAASVMGAISAVISTQLKLNVIAVIAAAENMPGSRASKPGDIVTSMSGKTIEILNTDAEGRLVLCDALTYVEQFKPASVIDVATLTGACVVALGNHASALYSNNEKLAEKIEQAGLNSWDRVWPMPLWPEYNEQLNSRFADLANIGGPKAGSITGACFLSNFTKKYHWAHLDIAGTAWNGPGPTKGATGRPVPLLVEYLHSLI